MRAYPELPTVSDGYPRAHGSFPTCSSPVRHVSHPKVTPSDLHALGTPPALILSQDQTLHQVRVSRHHPPVATGSPGWGHLRGALRKRCAWVHPSVTDPAPRAGPPPPERSPRGPHVKAQVRPDRRSAPSSAHEPRSPAPSPATCQRAGQRITHRPISARFPERRTPSLLGAPLSVKEL